MNLTFFLGGGNSDSLARWTGWRDETGLKVRREGEKRSVRMGLVVKGNRDIV